MSRWTSYTDPFGGHHVIELENRERYMLGDEADPDVYQEFVDDITKLHNADCDAYDALDEALNECIKDRDWFSDRLDAATAELARVKAESLRVVVDECQNMDIASDWYMTPDGLGWIGYDRHDCECVETPHGYHKFDDCRKVKLERWEVTE